MAQVLRASFANFAVEQGSEKMWIKEVQATGADLASPDTFGRFAVVKSSTLEGAANESTSNTTEFLTESQRKLTVFRAHLGGGSSSNSTAAFTWKLTGAIMQIDARTIEWLSAARGKTYIVVKELNSAANPDNEAQYLVMLGRFVGNISVAQMGTEQNFEFEGVPAGVDVTVTLNTAQFGDALKSFATPQTLTITEGSTHVFGKYTLP